MSGDMGDAPESRTSTLSAFAACALLAGCSILKPLEVAEPERQTPPAAVEPAEPEQADAAPVPGAKGRQASGADNLLAYFTQIRKLSGPDLAREHESARQAFNTGRSEFNRVRLAMVVTLPNTPFFDESRGLELLEPVWKNSESQLSALATLLASQIQERKRLDANAQALQQKLNALKSLERSLIERKR
jgi:hypothetical protein